MLSAVLQGWILGLGTGLLCAASCLPVMLPFMVAAGSGQARNAGRSLGEFLLGRLAAYLLLGLLAGLAGQQLQGSPLAIHLLGLATLLLGGLLLANGIGRSFPEARPCAALCGSRVGRRVPLAAGFVMGLSPCAPLLAALAGAAERGPLGALALMVSFFVASSWALLPLVGAYLPARRERLRGMAEVALVFAGLAFMVQGGLLLLR
ncbi:MAG: sulfite exporter TauE/SafE family protein [Armatimonadetes bacterium]|nr:sulfite exporter TauE/SafE family protein [Armatimonadota bacterium]